MNNTDPDLSNSIIIAICAKTMTEPGYGDFYIPALTPFLDMSVPYIKTDRAISKKNLINDRDIMDISPCQTTNYISLKVPNNEILNKGDKFLVMFLENDIQKPLLIRRYDDEYSNNS